VEKVVSLSEVVDEINSQVPIIGIWFCFVLQAYNVEITTSKMSIVLSFMFILFFSEFQNLSQERERNSLKILHPHLLYILVD